MQLFFFNQMSRGNFIMTMQRDSDGQPGTYWFSLQKRSSPCLKGVSVTWKGNSRFWDWRLCRTWPLPSLMRSFNKKKCYIHFKTPARWEVTSYDVLSSLAVQHNTSAIHLWHTDCNICPSMDMTSWPSLCVKYEEFWSVSTFCQNKIMSPWKSDIIS